MTTLADFARIASLAGDPARAAMLDALMDGRAFTATELSRVAGVTPQTASSHLAKLTEAKLVDVEIQGRRRYHRFASPRIAHMIESIASVASEARAGRPNLSVGPKDAALRNARTCYDHFAGALGVALTEALVAEGRIELSRDSGLLTDAGLDFLSEIGIDLAPMLARRTRNSGRVLCRACLDWSERRPHLAGAVGATICSHSMRMRWTRQQPGSRAVTVTRAGELVFRQRFRASLG